MTCSISPVVTGVSKGQPISYSLRKSLQIIIFNMHVYMCMNVYTFCTFFLIVSGYYPCPSLSWKDESDDKTMWQSGINNESLLLKAGINIDALLNQDYHKII